AVSGTRSSTTGQQCLYSPTDTRVLFVALLIAIEFFAFHRIESRASVCGAHGVAQLVFNRRRFELALGVMGPLPGQPVRRPTRMSPFDLLGAVRKRRARRPIKRGECLRIEGAG